MEEHKCPRNYDGSSKEVDNHIVNVNKNIWEGGDFCIYGGWWWLFDEGKATALQHLNYVKDPLFVWTRVTEGNLKDFWKLDLNIIDQ